jgi:hypothetical protein
VIEWIKKNIISIEFSFTTFRNRTVESITAGLSKTVADLEAHAAEQIEHMRLKTEAACEGSEGACGARGGTPEGDQGLSEPQGSVGLVMETSQEAYEAVKPHLNALHHKVLGALRARGGATVSEVVEDTGIIYATVLRRMSELKRTGLAVNTDQKRRNARGRAEVIAVAT